MQRDFLEILLVSGAIQQVPYDVIKSVAFVKDFDPPRGQPEQKTFRSRPKIEGLWVRMQFRDGELAEALLANNLALASDQGFLVTPPNSLGNIQRLFVPKTSLTEMVVLAVVGGRSAKPKTPAHGEQITLFDGA
ncbi:MAG: hypothetical protein LC114_15705 [Bryobacterales bacterium]|nr:hypothetical protein [Bryobacterales bacterium]